MIALQMYTLREFMKTPAALAETLRRVRAMGYECVQITPPAFTDASELAALLRSCGLRADSAICPLAQIPERIDQIARDATALETDVLRTDSIAVEDRCSAAGYRRAAEHLNRCGRLAKEKGLRFMYHFHAFEFVQLGDTRGIGILLQETDPQTVLFQPDVYWLAAAGTEPSQSLKRFSGRAAYMHLKDYVIVPSRTETLEVARAGSAPVGTGNLNWPGIFAAAREAGISHFVVEDDMGALDPFESAQMSLRALREGKLAL